MKSRRIAARTAAFSLYAALPCRVGHALGEALYGRERPLQRPCQKQRRKGRPRSTLYAHERARLYFLRGGSQWMVTQVTRVIVILDTKKPLPDHSGKGRTHAAKRQTPQTTRRYQRPPG